jgi:hypothetical protein
VQVEQKDGIRYKARVTVAVMSLHDNRRVKAFYPENKWKGEMVTACVIDLHTKCDKATDNQRKGIVRLKVMHPFESGALPGKFWACPGSVKLVREGPPTLNFYRIREKNVKR